MSRIVDCHTHINPDNGDVGLAEHTSAVKKTDACLVLAAPVGDSKEINSTLAEYVGRHRKTMVGLARVNPVNDPVSGKKLNAMIEKLGLKGIVLYCSENKFHPAHSRAMRLYESAQELGLPIFFHNAGRLSPSAVLNYAQPYLLDEIAIQFPALKLIIGNMGLPFVDQTLTMITKHENVYADLTIRPERTWLVYNIVMSAFQQQAMDKLLFGSGFPAGNAQNCIETLLGFNRLFADTNLPRVPRDSIRNIIERDTLALLGLDNS